MRGPHVGERMEASCSSRGAVSGRGAELGAQCDEAVEGATRAGHWPGGPAGQPNCTHAGGSMRGFETGKRPSPQAPRLCARLRPSLRPCPAPRPSSRSSALTRASEGTESPVGLADKEG